MRAVVKVTLPKVISDLEQQKNNDGSLQNSDENTSGKTYEFLSTCYVNLRKIIFKSGRDPNIARPQGYFPAISAALIIPNNT